MQVTGGNLINIWQFCASVYNCTDPAHCWMQDIRADVYTSMSIGEMAVSIMPGCAISVGGGPGKNVILLQPGRKDNGIL